MPSRVIRGEINRSDSLSQVSIEAELTFRALLMAADDYGRLDARPAILKAELFPMRAGATEPKIMAWLRELAALNDPPIVFYECDGRPYLYFPSWEDHRSKQKRGPKSRYPDPPQRKRTTKIPGPPRTSAEETVLTSGKVTTGKVVGGEQPPETPAPPATTATRANGAHPPLTDPQWSELRAWADSKIASGKLDRIAGDPAWLADQVERCQDYHAAKGKRIARWPNAVRNWIRKAEEFRARDAPAKAASQGVLAAFVARGAGGRH